MPLGCERAFGGTITLPPGERGDLPHPALTIAHAVNPRGRGYALDETSAVGVALPNIEFSDDRVDRWLVEPDPAVLAPEDGQIMVRLPRSPEAFESREVEWHLRLLHPCHRRAFGPALAAGSPFVLDGFRSQMLMFTLAASPVRLRLRRGRAWHDIGHHIRHVHVHLDHNRVEVLYGHAASFSPAQPVTEARAERAA